MTPVIDTHAHTFPLISRQDSQLLDPTGEGPWLRDNGDGTGMMMLGSRDYRPVTSALWDAGTRLAHMDATGVDVQVVSSTPLMFGYAEDPVRAAEWCAFVNDRMIDDCSGTDRLLPLAQVPLQSVEAACAEATRAARNGARGIHLGNHVGTRDLDDGATLEFLTHCAHEGLPVLVHPWDMSTDERSQDYMLAWLVGMAAETQLSVLRLMLTGAFEKLPESLQLIFAHGGGSFPYLLGRADNAWKRRDIVRGSSPKPPSAYLDRIHVDSAVFDQRALRLLVDTMGAERVLLGSDFPFPLGEEEPGKLIRDSDLTDAQKTALLGGNAARLFAPMEVRV